MSLCLHIGDQECSNISDTLLRDVKRALFYKEKAYSPVENCEVFQKVMSLLSSYEVQQAMATSKFNIACMYQESIAVFHQACTLFHSKRVENTLKVDSSTILHASYTNSYIYQHTCMIPKMCRQIKAMIVTELVRHRISMRVS